MDCPKCGGAMWDNRQSKKSPKQPDYRCKDRENCDGVIWPPRNQGGNRPNGTPPKAKLTWEQLAAIHRKSLIIAVKNCHDAFKGTAVPADVIAAAATVFIHASREGVQETPKVEPEDA